MLLSITTTHRPATDLGYLLAKHPDRLQTFALGFGEAHVFYPEASEERCTASLILDLDPVALVRGRPAVGRDGDGAAGPLANYVNDRPYVASSFLSVAIGKVLGSALGGRTTARPDLVAGNLPFSATIGPVRVRGGVAVIRRLLMPWSAKARSLIEEQYAPVGTAAIGGLNAAVQLLAAARARGVDIGDMQDRFEARRDVALRYDAAWRRYAWDVRSLDDLKLAPFHLLATEGLVHDDQDHAWHMRSLAEICACDSGVLLATAWREVSLDDDNATADAISWWSELTQGGGEGVVMKPGSFIARGSKDLVQPALKVRGTEYLRLIYGPEYTLPGKLERLRERGLSGKRGARPAGVRARLGGSAPLHHRRAATPRP